jgi:hypothetical protein
MQSKGKILHTNGGSIDKPGTGTDCLPLLAKFRGDAFAFYVIYTQTVLGCGISMGTLLRPKTDAHRLS